MKQLILALVALLIFAPVVFAEDWQHDKPPRSDHKFSPEDKEIFALMKDKHQDMIKEMEQMMEERKKLGELLRNPETTDAQIREQSKVINDRMLAINDKRTDDILSLRKKLPPEKFKKILDRFDEKREEMRDKFKDKSEKFGDRKFEKFGDRPPHLQEH